MNQITVTAEQLQEAREYNGVKLSLNAIRIYALLCQLGIKEGSCFPSHEFLAKKIGCTKRTVINAIKQLEESSLISVDRSERKNGKNDVNRYKIIQISEIKNKYAPKKGPKRTPSQGAVSDLQGENFSPEYINNNIHTDFYSTNSTVEPVEQKKCEARVIKFREHTNALFTSFEASSDFIRLQDKQLNTYRKLKNKYFIILHTVKKYPDRRWKINGQEYTSQEVSEAFQKLDFNTLKRILNYVTACLRNPQYDVKSDFAYWLTVIYNHINNISIELRSPDAEPIRKGSGTSAPQNSAKQNRFNDFPQRNYNMDELERLLLTRSQTQGNVNTDPQEPQKASERTYITSRTPDTSNQFCRFPQRNYSPEDYAEIERMLLSKRAI